MELTKKDIAELEATARKIETAVVGVLQEEDITNPDAVAALLTIAAARQYGSITKRCQSIYRLDLAGQLR